MKNKGVGIQAVFLLCLIMVLITGCAAPKKVSEASGSAKKQLISTQAGIQ